MKRDSLALSALHALAALCLGVLAAGTPGNQAVPDLLIDYSSDHKGNIEKCG